MNRLVVLLVGLMVLLCSVATAGDDVPWFDMDKCAFCKMITAEEGLAEHMQVEYHNLSSGMMSITVVDKEYMEPYERVQKKMEKLGFELAQATEMPYMCGYCCAHGEFYMAGLQPDHIRSKVGEIVIWTSDQPEMVKKLHAFAQRSIDECAKMEAKKAE